jgi:hypothetical protein
MTPAIAILLYYRGKNREKTLREIRSLRHNRCGRGAFFSGYRKNIGHYVAREIEMRDTLRRGNDLEKSINIGRL